MKTSYIDPIIELMNLTFMIYMQHMVHAVSVYKNQSYKNQRSNLMN